MREALAMVRDEFGAGASILHTREVAPGAIGRLWRTPMIEIAATPDRAPLAEQAMRAARTVTAPVGPSVAPKRPEPVAAPRDAQAGVSARPSVSSVSAYAELIAADFAGDFAREIVRAAEARPTDLFSAIHEEVSERVAVAGPIAVTPGQRRVAALVGPTGVGKTTTLAKLAANFRVRDGVRVGLVTVDTYRVAAVEQLRTYAQIIDLPMEVVADESQMRDAIDRLRDVDLVLIDTAGRSPRDAAHLAELRRLLEAASPDETHLVLSVTAGPRALADTLRRFAAVGPSRVLLTKLDEAPTIGHAAAPVAASGLPVSYLTDGQNVPEDIRAAQQPALAERLAGGAAA